MVEQKETMQKDFHQKEFNQKEAIQGFAGQYEKIREEIQ